MRERNEEGKEGVGAVKGMMWPQPSMRWPVRLSVISSSCRYRLSPTGRAPMAMVGETMFRSGLRHPVAYMACEGD